MSRPFHISWPGVLLLLAVLLSLSGCSLVWAVPAPGIAVVLAGLLIGLAAQTVRAHHERRLAVAPPAISTPAQPAAPAVRDAGRIVMVPAADPAESRPSEQRAAGYRVDGAATVRGDGLMDALAAQWLSEAVADTTPDARPLVFDSPASRAMTEGTGPAIAGDGFVTAELTDGAADGFLLVADKSINKFEGDSEAISRGGVTFNTRCGTYCHGGQAIGGGCPSLVDESWIHGDSELEIYRVIAGGAGEGTRMGAFGGELTGDEIWEIIAYLRSRGREYVMEKAGPGSFREQALSCQGEALLTIQSLRGRTYQGAIVIEDPKSITLEDRSRERPLRRRVLKNRIDTAELTCVDES